MISNYFLYICTYYIEAIHMANTSFRYLFLLLLPLFLLVANSCERSTTEKRILIVQSYEPDFQAYKDIEEAFKKGFQKEGIPASILSIARRETKNIYGTQYVIFMEA